VGRVAARAPAAAETRCNRRRRYRFGRAAAAALSQQHRVTDSRNVLPANAAQFLFDFAAAVDGATSATGASRGWLPPRSAPSSRWLSSGSQRRTEAVEAVMHILVGNGHLSDVLLSAARKGWRLLLGLPQRQAPPPRTATAPMIVPLYMPVWQARIIKRSERRIRSRRHQSQD